MKDLKKNDKIKYIGESGAFLTHNSIYKIVHDVEEFFELLGGVGVTIKDDTNCFHHITEDYFNEYFKKM